MRKNRITHNIFNRIITSLLVAFVLCITAFQIQAKGKDVVVQGIVTSRGAGYLIVRTLDGLKHQVQMNDQTHIFRDNPEFSIANLDKLVIQRSNIKIGSQVEVVAEVSESGYSASIVTVMSPDPKWRQTLAKK